LQRKQRTLPIQHTEELMPYSTPHLQRLGTRAGIADATSHSGRRTWLTELSSKGIGVRVLAEMAGHAASIQKTQR
jgi:integrase/recombinase XerD